MALAPSRPPCQSQSVASTPSGDVMQAAMTHVGLINVSDCSHWRNFGPRCSRHSRTYHLGSMTGGTQLCRLCITHHNSEMLQALLRVVPHCARDHRQAARLQQCRRPTMLDDAGPNNPLAEPGPDTLLMSADRRHLPGGDDEDAHVGKSGAANHVGHVVLVPWRVQDGVPLSLRLKQRSAHLRHTTAAVILKSAATLCAWTHVAAPGPGGAGRQGGRQYRVSVGTRAAQFDDSAVTAGLPLTSDPDDALTCCALLTRGLGVS